MASSSRQAAGEGAHAASDRGAPARGARRWLPRPRRCADFLRVRKGPRAEGEAFALEGRPRADGEGPPRVGFTVTRRVGTAVERNRIRRRLRAAAAELRPFLRSGCDYVLVARRPALWLGYDQLVDGLSDAVERLHARLDRPRPPSGAGRGPTRARSKGNTGRSRPARIGTDGSKE